MILRLLSYPRTLIMALLYPFFVVAISIVCISLNLLFNKKKIDDSVVRAFGKISCWMFGVDIQVEGIQNLPRGGSVFLFNHTSFFDIFAVAAAIPGIRFGAKIELFRIPVFGRAMSRVGILPIARQKKEEVFRVYKEAEERLRNGDRIALAPEGTRQAEEKLGQFKAGPFVFAISAQVPVVPIVIKNAANILSKDSYLPNLGNWSESVTVTVLPPIETKNLRVEDRPALQAKVLQSMKPFFEVNA